MRAVSRLHGATIALLGIGVLWAGCAEDIPVVPTPAAQAQAIFDPSFKLLPTPTDLAKNQVTGLLAVPVADETKQPAQAEFDKYLNSLDGFPTSATVSICFNQEIDQATVAGALTVLALPAAAGDAPAPVTDLKILGPTQTLACPVLTGMGCDPKADAPCGAEQVCVPADDEKTKGVCGAAGWRIVLAKDTPWDRARQYAFYLTNAIKTKDGKAVGRSSSFQLAAAERPVCEWNDTTRSCSHVYSTLLKSIVKAGAPEGLAEDKLEELVLESATTFEMLRQATDALLGVGVAAAKPAKLVRDDVILTWAFTTVSMTEAIFDPVTGVIPGPGNDAIYDQENKKVKIPEQPGETPTAKALREGLNTLDGFSTTGTYYTFFTDNLDATRLTGSDLLILNTLNPAEQITATFEFNRSAKALTMRPNKPLRENTRYAVVLLSKRNSDPTTAEEARASIGGLADEKGQRVVASPVFAMARFKNPLVDSDGKSTVSVLDDATAAQLEPLRSGYSLLFTLLGAMNVQREDVAILWTFQTQSITGPMTQLRALPYSLFGTPKLPDGTTDNPLYDGNTPKWTAVVDPTLSSWPATVPKDGVSALGKATLSSFNALDPATGAFRTDPTKGRPVTFDGLITLPKTPANAAKVPVVIFQHGIGTLKETFFLIANSLGQAGYAVISFDTIFHGDRNTCQEEAQCIATASCIVDNRDGYKRCCDKGVTANCGRAHFKPDTENPGLPIGNAALFLNTQNPFAIRDNIRQHVIDTVSVLRGLKLGALTDITNSTMKLDPTSIDLVSQSFGSIMNVIVLATDDTPKRAALSVAGGPITKIYELTQREDFKVVVDDLLDANGLCQEDAGIKVCPRDSAGALRLFHTLQWILDPADAANFARFVKTEQLPDLVANAATGKTDNKIPAKEVLQMVAGKDRLIDPSLQKDLASWMDVDVSKSTFPNQDHNFLREPDPDLKATVAAHTQVGTFLATGKVCTLDTTQGTCTLD